QCFAHRFPRVLSRSPGRDRTERAILSALTLPFSPPRRNPARRAFSCWASCLVGKRPLAFALRLRIGDEFAPIRMVPRRLFVNPAHKGGSYARSSQASIPPARP